MKTEITPVFEPGDVVAYKRMTPSQTGTLVRNGGDSWRPDGYSDRQVGVMLKSDDYKFMGNINELFAEDEDLPW